MAAARDWSEHIAVEPDVRGGVPVIRGTRVPVAVVVEAVAAGDEVPEVARGCGRPRHGHRARARAPACLPQVAAVT